MLNTVSIMFNGSKITKFHYNYYTQQIYIFYKRMRIYYNYIIIKDCFIDNVDFTLINSLLVWGLYHNHNC